MGWTGCRLCWSPCLPFFLPGPGLRLLESVRAWHPIFPRATRSPPGTTFAPPDTLAPGAELELGVDPPAGQALRGSLTTPFGGLGVGGEEDLEGRCCNPSGAKGQTEQAWIIVTTFSLSPGHF